MREKDHSYRTTWPMANVVPDALWGIHRLPKQTRDIASLSPQEALDVSYHQFCHTSIQIKDSRYVFIDFVTDKICSQLFGNNCEQKRSGSSLFFPLSFFSLIFRRFEANRRKIPLRGKPSGAGSQFELINIH